MGMLDGGAGLPSGVDDGLAVAEPGDLRVLLDPFAEGVHDRRRLLVGQHRPRVLVARRQHHDLVGTTGGGLGEDRPAVGHDEGSVPLEGRIEVGHHPHDPGALRPHRLERRRHLFLVARAEGTGPGGVRLDGRDPRSEGLRPGGPVGAHHHPTAGEGIESELVHQRWAPPLPVRRACGHARLGPPGGPSRRARTGRPELAHSLVTNVSTAGPATVPRRTNRPEGRAPRCQNRRMAGRRRAPVSIDHARDAAYDVVLLAHVLSALAGFGVVVVAGAYALALRRPGPPSEAVRRYYRPGANWAGRALFLVPVFGGALVAMSGGDWSYSQTWVLGGHRLVGGGGSGGGAGAVARRAGPPGRGGPGARWSRARAPVPAGGGVGGPRGRAVGGGDGRHGGQALTGRSSRWPCPDRRDHRGR